MKTLLQKLFNVYRHYKWATLLNLLGLSLAFTTCYVITRQAWYEFTFNHAIADHEQIYQFEQYFPNSKDINNQRFGNLARPFFIQNFAHLSPDKIVGTANASVYDILTSSHETPEMLHRTRSRQIDAGYTRVFGFEWLSGGTETFDNVENQAFIPASLAQKLYGSVDIVGKIIRNENVFLKILKKPSETFYTIVGVYRDFPENTSIGNLIYCSLGEKHKDNLNAWHYNGYIKLSSPSQQEALLKGLTYPKDFFNTWSSIREGESITRLFPLDNIYFNPYQTLEPNISVKNPQKGDKTITYMLLGIAGLILLIASINFINFSLALVPTRIRSINTQKVLGASVMSLRLTLLAEAIVLSFLAFLISLIEIQLLSYTPLTDLFSVDIALHTGAIPSVILCGSIALVVGALAGVWPAVYTTSVPMAMALKGAFNLSPKGVRMRNLLIGFQFTSALVLLTVALFFFLQYRYLLATPLGVETQHTVVTNFVPPNIILPEQQSVFINKLKNYAGTEAVTSSGNLLFNPYRGYNFIDDVKVFFVDENFIKTMGIRIVEGRNFQSGEPNKVLFNESARKQKGFKIGDTFSGSAHMSDNRIIFEVIGFIPDIKILSLQETSSVPFGLFLDNNSFVFYQKLKAGVNENEALAFAQQTADELTLFPGDASVRMLSDIADEQYKKEQKQIQIISLFCGLILFIAIMGVFGLVIFETQSRRKEIGICKINGASSSQIVWLFNRTYLLILLVCFAVSVPISWYIVQQWLEQFINHIPIYGWVFSLSLMVVSIITATTVSLQCWRTANANPVESIKSE